MIEAYKLEIGGVPEVGVGVQSSLEQRPPGARKRRRGGGGATAGHLSACRRFRSSRRRALSRNAEVGKISGPDSFAAVGPTRQRRVTTVWS